MERRQNPSDGETSGQLALLEDQPREWRLDERTRQVGRQGLAAARAALVRSGRRAA